MIIGKEEYGSKKLLTGVIAAAILVNFSLFFTKVIVDVTNVTALQFYSKIVESAQESAKSSGASNWLSDMDAGISAAISHSLGLESILGIGKGYTYSTSGGVSLYQTFRIRKYYHYRYRWVYFFTCHSFCIFSWGTDDAG
jgi:hypothetical protein